MNITEAVYQHNAELNRLIHGMDELLAHVRGPTPKDNVNPVQAGPMALLGDLDETGRKINALSSRVSELAGFILTAGQLKGETAPVVNSKGYR